MKRIAKLLLVVYTIMFLGLCTLVAAGDELTERPCIVMFTADYCGPCHGAKATLELYRSELNRHGISLIYYDVQLRPDKAQQYDIQYTPVFLAINSAGTVTFRTDNVYDILIHAPSLLY